MKSKKNRSKVTANTPKKENVKKRGHDEKSSQEKVDDQGSGGGESKASKESGVQGKREGEKPTFEELLVSVKARNAAVSESLFDAVVVDPVTFEYEEELKIIRPKGGGGTSFHIIFDYVRDRMQEDPPVSVIILTDGYAPFLPEEAAMDIPVLWIINNNEAKAPTWGKAARLVERET